MQTGIICQQLAYSSNYVLLFLDKQSYAFLVQIPWRENEDLFVAWRDGRTGFPWIDAIMIQV